MRDKVEDAGKKLLRLCHIPACAMIITAVQYLYVHAAVLGRQPLYGNDGRGDILFQLYFGGLFLKNSMDSFALMCSFGVFLAQVLLLNGRLAGEWFQNLELMLYRTERRSRLLNALFGQISLRNAGLVMCCICLACLTEGIVPSAAWIPAALLYFLQLEVFSLSVILGFLLLHNELVYVIFGLIYYIPVILLGFWHYYGNEQWKMGKYFLLLMGNWNYYVPLSITGADGTLLWNAQVFENVGMPAGIAVLSVLALLLYAGGRRALKDYQVI